jgi:hypothetical protein
MKKSLKYTFLKHKRKLLELELKYQGERFALIESNVKMVKDNDFLIKPDPRDMGKSVDDYCSVQLQELKSVTEKIKDLEEEIKETQWLMDCHPTYACSHCHEKSDFLGEIVYNLEGETLDNVCIPCIEKIHADVEEQKAKQMQRTNPFRNMSFNDIDVAFKDVCDHCGYGFLTAAYCPVCEEYNEREF